MQNFDDFEHYTGTENLKEVFRKVFDFPGSPFDGEKDAVSGAGDALWLLFGGK